jgi:LCP family protein required for cell wall assembly
MAGSPVVTPQSYGYWRPDPPQRRPPARARRLLITLNIFVAVCLLIAGTTYGYLSYRFGQIRRVGLADLVGGGGGDVGKPMTILLVGSDSRAGLDTSQDRKSFGTAQQAGGQRSDTIILLRLDPAKNQASLLSLPRDLYVTIPGTNHRDKINATFGSGPDLLIRAIHDDLGIDVNHYVEVDFNSFRGIVNSVSGVRVYFPTPVRDTDSGLNIAVPGCTSLNGDVALAYVRARHLEYFQNGRWKPEGESDLARIRRQQDFIRKMMAKAVSTGLTNPIRLNGVIGSLVSNITVDSQFSQSDMLSLAKRYRSFSGAELPSATLPTTAAVIAKADVLLPKQPDDGLAIDTFLGINPITNTTTVPPPKLDPATVAVKVLNGSGTPGQAAAVSRSLRQAGLVVTGTGTARSLGYTTPEIHFASGQDDKARYVQSMVIGGANLVPDSTLVGSDVELITGSSYAGLHPLDSAGAPAAAAPTPTTSTPPPLPGAKAGVPVPACS